MDFFESVRVLNLWWCSKPSTTQLHRALESFTRESEQLPQLSIDYNPEYVAITRGDRMLILSHCRIECWYDGELPNSSRPPDYPRQISARNTAYIPVSIPTQQASHPPNNNHSQSVHGKGCSLAAHCTDGARCAGCSNID